MSAPSFRLFLRPAGLLASLALAACATQDEPTAAGEVDGTLEATFFQERWDGGGATLLIRALDGAFIWENRAALDPGRREILFEYEVTTACGQAEGCAVRRVNDRLAFDAEAGHAYRLRAARRDEAARIWIEDLENGREIAATTAAWTAVRSEGYPNVAWLGLCADADRGDPKARRAIGLRYWHGWWPVRRDLVLAYQWLRLASAAGDGDAPHLLDGLIGEMSEADTARAEDRLAAWAPGTCVSEAALVPESQ